MKSVSKKRSERFVSMTTDPKFVAACETVKTPPTLRQWTKWKKHKGKAYLGLKGGL